MIGHIDAYLAIRQAAGFKLSNAMYLLNSFGRFAAGRGDTHLSVATAIDWASEARSVAQRHTRYETVRRFGVYAHLEDHAHEIPPPDYFGYRLIRRVPHIFSRDEVRRLVRAAQQLGPEHSLRPFTYAALISLLAAAGLRISEALNLLISDITPDGLLIRKTKFQKSRLVPLHRTATSGLEDYLARRQRLQPGGEYVFISRTGRRVVYSCVQSVFRELVKSAQIVVAPGRVPHLHDLRHTFAVRALEASPAGRRRIGQHMVALATYMGHVNIDATYWYLRTTPDLLTEIASASETFLNEVPR
jgi:integrase/recombinase XerD